MMKLYQFAFDFVLKKKHEYMHVHNINIKHTITQHNLKSKTAKDTAGEATQSNK